MLKKVVYVAVLVTDQDRALDFYTNVIGLEKRGDYPTPDGPRFLTVGVKGQDFELVLWPGTPGKAKSGTAVYTMTVRYLGAGSPHWTISATGCNWAWGPAKGHENHSFGRMVALGAARSRLAMEQARPSNCLTRSVRD